MEAYERMREFIDKRHLKQSSIAQDMGIKESTLSMMLHGKRNITLENFRRFCCSVNARPEEFCDFVNFSESEM